MDHNHHCSIGQDQPGAVIDRSCRIQHNAPTQHTHDMRPKTKQDSEQTPTQLHMDMGKIFERLGYVETERLYTKWIGD